MSKKKWGQNFLQNQNVVKSIIQIAKLKEGETVLEIGPGKGILTKAFLEKNASVTAIEIDKNLCDYLKLFLKEEKNFSLIEADVMKISGESLSKLIPRNSKLISYLPYNIVSPLLLKVFPFRKVWKSFTLMVQLEVAERICAKPNSGKIFGPLSLVGELGFEKEIKKIISPENFSPKPNVNSAIITLIPKESGLNSGREKDFLKWSHTLFRHRRKTLVNVIKRNFPYWYENSENSLKKTYGKKRPENLEIQEWKKLFENFLSL